MFYFKAIKGKKKKAPAVSCFFFCKKNISTDAVLKTKSNIHICDVTVGIKGDQWPGVRSRCNPAQVITVGTTASNVLKKYSTVMAQKNNNQHSVRQCWAENKEEKKLMRGSAAMTGLSRLFQPMSCTPNPTWKSSLTLGWITFKLVMVTSHLCLSVFQCSKVLCLFTCHTLANVYCLAVELVFCCAFLPLCASSR